MARFVVHVFAGDGERVEGTVQREGAGPPAVYCGWLELLRILEPPRGVDGFADEREATGEASCGSSRSLPNRSSLLPRQNRQTSSRRRPARTKGGDEDSPTTTEGHPGCRAPRRLGSGWWYEMWSEREW